MDERLSEAEAIGQAVAGLDRQRRTEQIPEGIRTRVIKHARRRREGGEAWARIAQEVGLSPWTLQRWVRKAEKSDGKRKGLVAVSVRTEERRTVAVVLPGGVRVEGLGLEEAIYAARSLV